jgi:hypothetical protein
MDRESFFCSFLIFVEIVYEYTMGESCNELMKDIYKEIKTQETVHLQCPMIYVYNAPEDNARDETRKTVQCPFTVL